MQRVVVNIPDNEYNFFMKLVKNLSFVKISDEPKLTKKQKEFVAGVQHSLEQVKQHQDGKIKLQPAREFLNEL